MRGDAATLPQLGASRLILAAEGGGTATAGSLRKPLRDHNHNHCPIIARGALTLQTEFKALNTQMPTVALSPLSAPSLEHQQETETLQGNFSTAARREEDGKRALIKNQLNLIEQLQLENANLRNERDQLQLENEELKFQLQMISSSNILSQPSTSFSCQQFEHLVASQQGPPDKQAQCASTNANQRPQNSNDIHRDTAALEAQIAQLGVQQPAFAAAVFGGQPKGVNQTVAASAATTNCCAIDPTPQAAEATNGRQRRGAQLGKSVSLAAICTSTSSSAVGAGDNATRNDATAGGCSGDATSAGAAATNDFLGFVASSALLSHEQRVAFVEQRFGGAERANTAAALIQRAYRRHQICKRFRTITEQLRHSSSNAPGSPSSSDKSCATDDIVSSQPLPYLVHASGVTRRETSQSLSHAASRLAAAAKRQSQMSAATDSAGGGGSSLMTDALESATVCDDDSAKTHLAVVGGADKMPAAIVKAAINFQQLEAIRKRQYRLGLNIFNASSDKGISFLVAHQFIDWCAPKEAAKHDENLSSSICQFCVEEENLKRNVALFLLNRKGLAKEKIGAYLGNLQQKFNQDVLRYYLAELDFGGIQVDAALRKFLATFRLPGEAQKIERIVEAFSARYVQCQQQLQQQQQFSTTTVSAQQPLLPSCSSLSRDEILILTFAIIMLNTDLHSPSLKSAARMSSAQFVSNLRGVFKSPAVSEADLVEIYERVKASQITTLPDQSTQVLKVQESLIASGAQSKRDLPSLCAPQRRLVCSCRLFELYDPNKKERVGQHQREIFLFNDLLLVTKLVRRVRSNVPAQYSFRQSITLAGLQVQLFSSPHYSYGIRLVRPQDELCVMFNARNELDRSRLTQDICESVREAEEMDLIRANHLDEIIHERHLDRLRQHSKLHAHSNQRNQQLQFVSTAVRLKKSDSTSAVCGSSSTTSGQNVPAKSLENVMEETADERRLRSKKSQSRQQPPLMATTAAQTLSTRRISAASLHSLDSGLILSSRDVSPNLSS